MRELHLLGGALLEEGRQAFLLAVLRGLNIYFGPFPVTRAEGPQSVLHLAIDQPGVAPHRGNVGVPESLLHDLELPIGGFLFLPPLRYGSGRKLRLSGTAS